MPAAQPQRGLRARPRGRRGHAPPRPRTRLRRRADARARIDPPRGAAPRARRPPARGGRQRADRGPDRARSRAPLRRSGATPAPSGACSPNRPCDSRSASPLAAVRGTRRRRVRPSSRPAGRRWPSRTCRATAPRHAERAANAGPLATIAAFLAARGDPEPGRARWPTRCWAAPRPAASPCSRRSAASPHSRRPPCRCSCSRPPQRPRRTAGRAQRRGGARDRRRGRVRRGRRRRRSSAPCSATATPASPRSPSRTCSRWRCSAWRACSSPTPCATRPPRAIVTVLIGAAVLHAHADRRAGRRRRRTCAIATLIATTALAAGSGSRRACRPRGSPFRAVRSREARVRRRAHRSARSFCGSSSRRGIWLDEATSRLRRREMSFGRPAAHAADDRRPPAAAPPRAVGDDRASSAPASSRCALPSIVAGTAMVPLLYAARPRALRPPRRPRRRRARRRRAVPRLVRAGGADVRVLHALRAARDVAAAPRRSGATARSTGSSTRPSAAALVWTQYFGAASRRRPAARLPRGAWRTPAAGPDRKRLASAGPRRRSRSSPARPRARARARTSSPPTRRPAAASSSPLAGRAARDRGGTAPGAYAALTNPSGRSSATTPNATMAALTALWPLGDARLAAAARPRPLAAHAARRRLRGRCRRWRCSRSASSSRSCSRSATSSRRAARAAAARPRRRRLDRAARAAVRRRPACAVFALGRRPRRPAAQRLATRASTTSAARCPRSRADARPGDVVALRAALPQRRRRLLRPRGLRRRPLDATCPTPATAGTSSCWRSSSTRRSTATRAAKAVRELRRAPRSSTTSDAARRSEAGSVR